MLFVIGVIGQFKFRYNNAKSIGLSDFLLHQHLNYCVMLI